MERRRDHANSAIGGARTGQIRMTLEADQPHFVADERARVGGSMRLMATAASLEADGSMIEGEWPALITMAGDATALVGGEGLSHGIFEASVRIVAVDAIHRILHEPVTVGLLKRSPDIQVTRGAELIDC